VIHLGLPDNRSYRSYTDLHRPYVVWNVVAAPQFSVRPRHWCFPISGCITYRGYFNRRRAQAFAARLAARGDDVQVDGVAAFSTLGHFADPVLSSMLRYGDLAGYLRGRRLEDQIDALFTAARTRLSRLYARTLPMSVKRARKQALLA